MTSNMTAKQVKNCLKARHPAPEWVWAEEFALVPGFVQVDAYGGGRIDGLALNCYPSRGHLIVGYEVKVSRGDFLAELKQPEKRRLAVSMVDRFFFAVPRGLVRPDEIPADCGLIECWMGDFGVQSAEKDQRPNSRLRLDRWPKKTTRHELLAKAVGELPRWFASSIIRQFDPARQAQAQVMKDWNLKNRLDEYVRTRIRIRGMAMAAWKASVSL